MNMDEYPRPWHIEQAPLYAKGIVYIYAANGQTVGCAWYYPVLAEFIIARVNAGEPERKEETR